MSHAERPDYRQMKSSRRRLPSEKRYLGMVFFLQIFQSLLQQAGRGAPEFGGAGRVEQGSVALVRVSGVLP